MNLSLMFSIRAMLVALFTNLSPPKINAARPPTIINAATPVFLFDSSGTSSSDLPDLKDQ